MKQFTLLLAAIVAWPASTAFAQDTNETKPVRFGVSVTVDLEPEHILQLAEFLFGEPYAPPATSSAPVVPPVDPFSAVVPREGNPNYPGPPTPNFQDPTVLVPQPPNSAPNPAAAGNAGWRARNDNTRHYQCPCPYCQGHARQVTEPVYRTPPVDNPVGTGVAPSLRRDEVPDAYRPDSTNPNYHPPRVRTARPNN